MLNRPLLITVQELKVFRPLSETVNKATQLDPYIREAQDMDIEPVIGAALFEDMINNLTVEKYTDLLNGKQYENSEGKTVSFMGLKAALSYYAWSRYILYRNTQDTPSGMVTKTNDFSTPVDSKVIAQQSNQCKLNGEKYLQDCIRFLKTFPAVYDLFDDGCRRKTGGNSFKMFSV